MGGYWRCPSNGRGPHRPPKRPSGRRILRDAGPAASAPALSASITVIDTRSDLSHDTKQLSLFGAPTLMGNSIVWPFTASWPSH
jgi:hypothetical protein